MHSHLALSILFLVFIASPLRADTSAEAAEAEGLHLERVEYREHPYEVVHVDLRKARLELFWKNDAGAAYGNFAELADALKSEGRELVFATNAGIYAKDRTPLGLHIEGAAELRPLNRASGGGNFFLQPNGVFYVESGEAFVQETERFVSGEHRPELAVQSGPMLLLDGDYHPRFLPDSTSFYIRNGVGVVGSEEVVFVLSLHPVNFHTFASFFREVLHCDDALYLDGSLSNIYYPAKGRKPRGTEFVGMLGVAVPTPGQS